MNSKRKREPTTQLVGYDLVLPCKTFSKNDVVKMLQEWAKKYVFQKEKGSTGYLHWQIRLHLVKKRRKAELLKLGFGKGGDLSITSASVHANNNFNYVMKKDTRVEGPWTEKDYVEPPDRDWET